jgi:hypothetical protein
MVDMQNELLNYLLVLLCLLWYDELETEQIIEQHIDLVDEQLIDEDDDDD